MFSQGVFGWMVDSALGSSLSLSVLQPCDCGEIIWCHLKMRDCGSNKCSYKMRKSHAGTKLLPPTSIAEWTRHCCPVSWPFVFWHGRSGTVVHPSLPPSQNVTEALPKLGHKAVGLSSLLLNGWWILNHSSVLGVYSHSKTLWLTKNKSCTNVLKLVLLKVLCKCPDSDTRFTVVTWMLSSTYREGTL